MNAGLKHFFSWCAWLLEWFVLFLLGGVGYTLDVQIPNAREDPIFLQTMVAWIQGRATEIGLCLAAFIVLSRFIRWLSREQSPESKVLDRVIMESLDNFRQCCFRNVAESVPRDHNRVTVFKHVRWRWWIWPFKSFLNPWGWGRWPWSGWLVAAHRSGHLTKQGVTAFLAPDDAPNSEGVAGQAWRREAYRVGRGENKLPDLNNVVYRGYLPALWLRSMGVIGNRNSNVEAYEHARLEIAKYAEATHTSPRLVWQRIKRNKVCPTSLLSVPILDSRNERWGVVVMDSCNDIECIDTDTKWFRTGFTTLTKALRKSGLTTE